MSIILQKSWLVHKAVLDNATFPTPTLDTIRMTGAGQYFVADFSIASSVM